MSRRHRRKPSEFQKITAIIFLICFALSTVGVSLNPDIFLGVVIFVLVIALVGVFLSTPIMRGKIGELKISLLLKSITKKYNGKVINDVIIIDENNKSSQIDHVLFHTSGIYVIETKNYSGRIYGTENQKEWTQVLAYGNRKNKLYNPLFQNYTHLVRLEKLFGNIKTFNSCVVFVKGNINYIEANNVYTPNSLKRFILDNINDTIYTENEINDLYNKLLEYKLNPVKTTKEHVEDIKIMRTNIDNNICPNCNIPLVLKTSKEGNKFYGCSNYPKCKFTKKI